MKLLLDTHALLWFSSNDPRLGTRAAALISDGNNERLLSVASLWEVAIKVSIGRLRLDIPLEQLCGPELTRHMTQLLPISPAHVVEVSKLPFHHRDPFDRMLAAQALTDGLTVVSNDQILDRYGVTRIW